MLGVDKDADDAYDEEEDEVAAASSSGGAWAWACACAVKADSSLCTPCCTSCSEG